MTIRWSAFPILATAVFMLPRSLSATIGYAVADAYVSSKQPNSNFGADRSLVVSVTIGTIGLITSNSLLKVDLSNLPPGLAETNIQKATLTVFVNRLNNAGSLDFSRVTGPWL